MALFCDDLEGRALVFSGGQICVVTSARWDSHDGRLFIRSADLASVFRAEGA